MSEFQKLLIEGIFISFPYAIIYVLIGLLLCGYKERISSVSVIKFAALISLTDSLITFFSDKYEAQPIVYALCAALLIWIIFKLNIKSSLIASVIGTVFAFLQLPVFLGIFSIIGEDIKQIESNYLLRLSSSYILFAILSLIILIIYKKDFVLINLKKHTLLSNTNNESKHDYSDNIRIIGTILTPTIILLTINFSISYYEETHDLIPSPTLYVTINTIGLIISSLLMIYLARKIINLRRYKIEWSTQQKYLNDVNQLLKSLRSQKHGFINHMNIIYGLITLEEYDNAKEYLSNIQDAVSTKGNVISVDNPTLSALLNAKSQVAENKKIKFNVNIDKDLSQMNFRAFELGEAITNIIDNGFEATCELEERDRNVSISISSNNNFYIFNIENTGKEISKDIIKKLFDEGFTTKKHELGDHGFGLFISKKIIEDYQGKIEVYSSNGKTLFKIFLPKVIKNEFKAS